MHLSAGMTRGGLATRERGGTSQAAAGFSRAMPAIGMEARRAETRLAEARCGARQPGPEGIAPYFSGERPILWGKANRRGRIWDFGGWLAWNRGRVRGTDGRRAAMAVCCTAPRM